MAEDLPYREYEAETARLAAALEVEHLVRSSGRYRRLPDARSDEEGGPAAALPQPLPGYTILAEPCPIDAQNAARLQGIQQVLRAVPGFVAVPPTTFHMTAADLVFGRRFSEQRRQPGWRRAFERRIATLLARTHPDPGGPTGAGARIVGLALFAQASVIAALIGFAGEADYRCILELRDRLYRDSTLAAWGVERNRPFQGHVTLGYLERARPENLATVLTQLRHQHGFGWALRFEGVRLYWFPHMSYYEAIGGTARLARHGAEGE